MSTNIVLCESRRMKQEKIWRKCYEVFKCHEIFKINIQCFHLLQRKSEVIQGLAFCERDTTVNE